MVELPDTAPQLEDLLRATDALILDWRTARRTMEDAVHDLVTWLFERERFDRRKRRLGTFAGDDQYTVEDFERARQLPQPLRLWRMGEIDERLQPYIDRQEQSKIGQELETFWQLAVEICLRLGGGAVDEIRRIAEQREQLLKRLRDTITAKRDKSLKEQSQAMRRKEGEMNEQARHSPDFASVYWFGNSFTFTTNQAACVRVLWEAWENKTPVLGGHAIIDAAGVDRSDERLDLVFRDNPAWGTMIGSPSKGRYCLKASDVVT